MKKLISLFGIIGLFVVLTSNAQSAVASRWDVLAWDNANVTSLLAGYDVAFTATSVTAANLGTNLVINNAISSYRVIGGANTQVILTNVIPTSTVASNYLLYVRAVDTNSLVSSWSSPLSLSYVVPPSAPTNLRIIRVP